MNEQAEISGRGCGYDRVEVYECVCARTENKWESKIEEIQFH